MEELHLVAATRKFDLQEQVRNLFGVIPQKELTPKPREWQGKMSRFACNALSLRGGTPEGPGERSLSFCLKVYCKLVDAPVEVMV